MFNWVAGAIAYRPGVLCGLVIGHVFILHNQVWVAEIFVRKKTQRLYKCSLSPSFTVFLISISSLSNLLYVVFKILLVY